MIGRCGGKTGIVNHFNRQEKGILGLSEEGNGWYQPIIGRPMDEKLSL